MVKGGHYKMRGRKTRMIDGEWWKRRRRRNKRKRKK